MRLRAREGFENLTTAEQIERLMELYLDAREWRTEESVLLQRLQRDLDEIRVELQQLRLETNGFSLRERLKDMETKMTKVLDSTTETVEKVG